MSDFGDADPEDAYDANDPLHERLRVIGRAIIFIVALRRTGAFDKARLLARLTDLQRIADGLRAELDLAVDDQIAVLIQRTRDNEPEP